MTSELPFPAEPGRLTAGWLTDVLRASRALTTGAVAAHAWELVPQQGGASVVGRASLTYDGADPDAPPTVIIKFATPYAPIRGVMHRFGFYRAEVGFYRDLGDDAGVSVPRCYHAEIDVPSGHFVLVLEDMKESRAGDPFHPQLADVETAIDSIAGFHARWWGSPRLRELDWLVYPEGPALQARMAGLQQSFGGALAAVRQRLGAGFPAILGEASDRMLADWTGFFSARGDFTPTLVHRDYHPQQLFYASQGGGRFAVFDWQTITIGCGADDVARIISLGLRTADRAANEERLVERYHAALLAHGVRDYPLERCRRHARFGLVASLMTNIVAAATIDWSIFKDRVENADAVLVYGLFGRLGAAFEANDVLALLPRRAS